MVLRLPSRIAAHRSDCYRACYPPCYLDTRGRGGSGGTRETPETWGVPLARKNGMDGYG
jgi:hypothetical protein